MIRGRKHAAGQKEKGTADQKKKKEKKGRDAAGQREEGHGWPEGREMIRRRRDAAGQREEDTAS